MLPSHLFIVNNGLYKYRRRTPKELKEYLDSDYIIKSLGKDTQEAYKKALELTQVINQSALLAKMSMPSSAILALLENIIPTKQSNVKDIKATSAVIEVYLRQSQVTPLELSNRTYFFKSMFPALLKVILGDTDPSIENLSFDKIIKIRDLLSKLPNKNHSNYKSQDLTSLILGVYKGTIVIPDNHLLAIDTLNRYLKRIKTLLLFAQELGLYSGNIPKTMTIQKQGTTDRDYKAVLASHELSKVLSSVPDSDLAYVYKVLYFTGMRRSELYKCRVSEIEGIKCFDLRLPKVNLKTKSSYRIIPVHSKLMNNIAQFEDIVASIKPDRMTKVFTRLAKAHLDDSENKSMYSLRHTFATDLIAKGVQPEIVSELMGHSHSTMTMNRYVKGYPIKVLKEAIDNL